jgi:hypothetical protein
LPASKKRVFTATRIIFRLNESGVCIIAYK